MSVAETRDKVQRILTKNLNSVEVDSDGDFKARFGSTACFVSVRDWADGDTLVRLFAPVLREVAPNPEVYRWGATEGQAYVFGGALVTEADDGSLFIGFKHTLLGTFLDEDELMHALGAVASTADKLDDDLQTRFGGSKFTD